MLVARQIVIVNLDGLLIAANDDVKNNNVPSVSDFKIFDSSPRATTSWSGSPISMLPFLPEEWDYKTLTSELSYEETVRRIVWNKRTADCRLVICSAFDEEDFKKASIKYDDLVSTPADAVTLIDEHLGQLAEKDIVGIVKWASITDSDQQTLDTILRKHGAEAHQYKYPSF